MYKLVFGLVFTVIFLTLSFSLADPTEPPKLINCYNCYTAFDNLTDCSDAPENMTEVEVVVPCSGVCVLQRIEYVLYETDATAPWSIKRSCSNDTTINSQTLDSFFKTTISTCHFSFCNLGDGRSHYPKNYTAPEEPVKDLGTAPKPRAALLFATLSLMVFIANLI